MSVASTAVDELWSLLDTPTIDPGRLAAAVEAAAGAPDLDWRTRQLIGEAWRALTSRFGREDLTVFLTSYDSTQSAVGQTFADHDPTEVKFPSLPDRLEFRMKAATIKQFLAELGEAVDRPLTVTLGGSASLILQGHLDRHTEDLDLADEIPAPIREVRSTLSELTRRFGLKLAHFQTHYLPPGWASRTTDGGSCGKILLRLVDPYDIIAGKAFSSRTRDRDDVRVTSRRMDKDRLLARVHEYPASVWNDARLRDQALKTWRLVFLEELPLPPHAAV